MPAPILTIEQRQELRALYATGDYTQQELAECYGVTQTNVSAIIRRPARKCVDCGVPLLLGKRCETCNKVHNTAASIQWAREHKEIVNERQRTRWATNEEHRARHRVSARESQRRRYARQRAERGPRRPKRVHTKHVFTMSANQDGTAILQCVRCELAYSVTIQASSKQKGA